MADISIDYNAQNDGIYPLTRLIKDSVSAQTFVVTRSGNDLSVVFKDPEEMVRQCDQLSNIFKVGVRTDSPVSVLSPYFNVQTSNLELYSPSAITVPVKGSATDKRGFIPNTFVSFEDLRFSRTSLGLQGVDLVGIAMNMSTSSKQLAAARKLWQFVTTYLALATQPALMTLVFGKGSRTIGMQIVSENSPRLSIQIIPIDDPATDVTADIFSEKLRDFGKAVNVLACNMVGQILSSALTAANIPVPSELDRNIQVLGSPNFEDFAFAVAQLENKKAIETGALASIKGGQDSKNDSFLHSTSGIVTIGVSALAAGYLLSRSINKR